MNIGKIVGVALFSVATAAIWLLPGTSTPDAPEPLVRPVRSEIVRPLGALPAFSFTGRVKADTERKLSFKESGRIESIPVISGQIVKKGTVLASLYKGDFTNNVERCRAVADRDRLSVLRIREASKHNAVSAEELSRAEAQLRQSEAQLQLAERALRGCEIYAPFDCVVANVHGRELTIANPGQEIVTVQNREYVKIDVAVPETVVIMQRQIRYNTNCVVQATFDAFPKRQYAAEFVEYVSEPDNRNQAYIATYRMKKPDDLLLLPGMSATITVPAGMIQLVEDESNRNRIEIPASAVGADGFGGFFVWVLKEAGDGVYAVEMRKLTHCSRCGERVAVGGGLVPGERIAVAGIEMLNSRSRVTLMKE